MMIFLGNFKVSSLQKRLILLFIFSMFFYESFSTNFTDDFNNGTAHQWKEYAGQWEVRNKQYVVNSTHGYSLAAEVSYLNFIYESDIQVSGRGSAGLIFNVTNPFLGIDSFNGYYIALNSGKDYLYLYKVNRKVSSNKRIIIGNALHGNREEIIAIPYVVHRNNVYHLKVVKEGNFIDIFIDNNHIFSIVDKVNVLGQAGVMSDSALAIFDNIKITDRNNIWNPTYNWSWVKGVTYIPTNCVNVVQQWEEFDPSINDRELLYAQIYSLNVLRIYLHYLVYEKDKRKFLNDLETFLKLAEKHKLKTEIIFFDDMWNKNPHLGPQFPPIPGRHNSRWMQCPGEKIKDEYESNKAKLKSYVQDVVNAHKNDPRIVFWEPYNEPGYKMQGKYLQVSKQLVNDSRIWIKQTGTTIPLTSTAEPDFMGEAFSDFFSWHDYTDIYRGPKGPEVLNTECMERQDQTVKGIVEHYGMQQTGYIIWELGIGRDNCRFHWNSPQDAIEVIEPFHGLIYPDGHPYDTNEIKFIRGYLEDLAVFNVKYFNGNFDSLKKSSFTPCIDFDLGNEKGTGSPDASALIPVDSFSIQWAGKVQIESQGEYIFYIDSDNLARLWVDGLEVINKESNKREEVKKTISLGGLKVHDIQVEYVHYTGDASMHLSWSGPGFERKVLTAANR
jgi:hypothetical protein